MLAHALPEAPSRYGSVMFMTTAAAPRGHSAVAAPRDAVRADTRDTRSDAAPLPMIMSACSALRASSAAHNAVRAP